MAQKKVLLLSEKPVIHEEGLIDVGLHQSAGVGLLEIVLFICGGMGCGGLTQSVEWLLSHICDLITGFLGCGRLSGVESIFGKDCDLLFALG